MPLENTLKNIGLDEKERQIYLKLLELGEASMTELAKATYIKRPTAYLVVEELQIQGLVSEVQIGKRKKYTATHPRRLLQMARARERQMQEVLPELVALYNQPSNKPRIQVFEGKVGMRLVYKEIFESLKKKNEVLFFANVEAIYSSMPDIVDEFKHNVGQLKHICSRELHYHNHASKKWKRQLAKELRQGYQVRLLDPEFEFGLCDNAIFENKLVIFSLKKDLFVIVIESEEIAKTYRAMFEWAWKMGKDICDL